MYQKNFKPNFKD